jgi:hypothetical protein
MYTVTVTDHSHHLGGTGKNCKWTPKTVEAEVLTLHFATGHMRVRYKEADRTRVIDTDIQPFFDKYTILDAGDTHAQ